MRRQEFSMQPADARGELERAPYVHLAGVDAERRPVLRALNFVVLDGAILFHGAKAGEKLGCVDGPAVVSTETQVATIPSYFVDPVRACPATTFFISVQAHGTLRQFGDVELKARALSALMEKYQPERGYAPIDSGSALYGNALRGVALFGLAIDRLTGKAKFGQNMKSNEIQAIVEGLWSRGNAGDARAIALVLAHNPDVEPPARFRGPAGTTLCPALDRADAAPAASLLEDQYWTRGVAAEELVRAHLGSAAWVGARDPEGRLVASARAISDGSRHAYIADVVVSPAWRRRGLGRTLVELLLDHPALRHVRNVRLSTKDAQGFYRSLGFCAETEGEPPFVADTLVRRIEPRSPAGLV